MQPMSPSPSRSSAGDSTSLSEETSSTRAVTSSSWIDSWTKSRSTEVQDWPAAVSAPNAAPAAVRAMSTSSKTIIGSLPPSSSSTGINSSAAWRRIARPVRADPVNMTWSGRWPITSEPTVPSPYTICSQCGAIAACSASDSTSPSSGVCSLGL